MAVNPIQSAKFMRKRYYEKYKQLSSAIKCLSVDYCTLAELKSAHNDIRHIIAMDALTTSCTLSYRLYAVLKVAKSINEAKAAKDHLIKGLVSDINQYIKEYDNYSEKIQRIKAEAIGG